MFLRRLLLAGLTVGMAIPISTAKADDEKGKSVIKGVANFDGAKPKVISIQMTQDPVCMQKHPKGVPPQGDTVFDDGTLPYVFVYVKSGLKGKYTEKSWPMRKDEKDGKEHKDVQIDQNTCLYKPHVQGMMTGQPITIVNSDPTAHNIHAKPKKNTEFNISQPKKDLTTTREGKDTFNKLEVMVEIKCDVHPWMSAYVGVVDHPFFATTGKGGTFEIKDLPAGEYVIEAWHEKWGKMEQTVKVRDGETKEIEFKFTKKKAEAPANGHDVRTVAMSAGSDSCCSGGSEDQAVAGK